MIKNTFIQTLKLNIKTIYSNISNVFGLTDEEFKELITNMINSFRYNRKLNEKKIYMNIFSIENLLSLKNILEKIGLGKEEIKKIIIKSPIIILYSDKLGKIYYIYKNKKYYGYTILDNKEFETYLLNDNLSSNIISNNYIVKQMLDYYGVKSYDKESFDTLEKELKVKNYYFKKKGL